MSFFLNQLLFLKSNQKLPDDLTENELKVKNDLFEIINKIWI